ncbi:S8 family serine peptidase [Marinobacter litoralis]|uniref:S8 family serine peptidase n=1 Tax=Marinobacter litoralis TaxID=187981 RepID=UPI0018EA9265|nr:S8 family serine peptidase [Marinobacter litoralis]MBJ6136999.1 S8 family serine peptidase [Marinobacter litoralis]
MMKRPTFHWLMVPALLIAPGLAQSVGPSGLIDGRIDSISEQVERRAEALVERKVAERTRERMVNADELPEQLQGQLSELLPVRTRNGETAFYEALQRDGSRAVARQWLITATADELVQLRRPGVTILEQRELEGLGLTVVRFQVRPDIDSRAALEKLLPELSERLDRNHIYSPQSRAAGAVPNGPQQPIASLCSDPVRVGMVDTLISDEHSAFDQASIIQKPFLTMANQPGELTAPRAHGTAVASVLMGQLGAQSRARLPHATLFNASVFYEGSGATSGATLAHLLEGLNWLAEQKTSVINISLTGPDNRILAAAIKSLQKQGPILVAAVGNEGPAAPPLYPAAYEGVIGVTAVDNAGALYRWANRGNHVAFAARGVDVPVAHTNGGLVRDSGTSLAAPVVAALLACSLPRMSKEQAIQALIDHAEDLGDKGRDPGFGHGFLDDQSERFRNPPAE